MSGDGDADAFDRLRRRVLWMLPTGLYLIGSRAEGRHNLMTANLVTQVAVEPKLVAVAVQRDALTYELVSAGGAFSVCVLDREDRALVRRFVKPVTDVEVDDDGAATTVGGEAVAVGRTGVPILARSLAWLECEVRHRLDLGSHVLFVGEVVDVGVRPGGSGSEGAVLRMEDTRMNYGG